MYFDNIHSIFFPLVSPMISPIYLHYNSMSYLLFFTLLNLIRATRVHVVCVHPQKQGKPTSGNCSTKKVTFLPLANSIASSRTMKAIWQYNSRSFQDWIPHPESKVRGCLITSLHWANKNNSNTCIILGAASASMITGLIFLPSAKNLLLNNPSLWKKHCSLLQDITAETFFLFICFKIS